MQIVWDWNIGLNHRLWLLGSRKRGVERISLQCSRDFMEFEYFNIIVEQLN